MNEWIMILTMALGGVLFAAGGTHIDGIGGQKWLRRFVLPLALLIIALPHTEWYRCVGYAITLSFFLHLGYGHKSSWLYRAFIFSGYGLSALWLGWTLWTILTPLICCGMFFLSNWKPTAHEFFWKLVEFSMGSLIAFTFIAAL